MSHGDRQPSPRRNGRQHAAHRERSLKRTFEERFKDEYDELKRKAKWKPTRERAFVFFKYTSALWKPGELLPELPSRSHERRPKPNRHRSHHERSPGPRGRHWHHHGSRRELRDASYQRWPHGSSTSTPRPTHSQARPHARRPTRLPEDCEGFHHARFYEHSVLHPGFDPPDTLGDLDDDDHGPLIHTPSDSEDGYDSDLSEALPGLGTDRNEDLDVVTPSGLEKESTASLRGPQPQPQGVATTGLKHTSTDPGRDHAKDPPYFPPSLNATLDTDFNDTAPDSDEDDARDSYDTPPSLHGISDPDENEGSDPRFCSSDSDGDEENRRQATILSLQVVKVDLGDGLPNSEENRNAPLRSSPPNTSEDYQVENIRNAATSPHQVAHVDIGDTYSDSNESEDEDPVTDLIAASINASLEDEREVDDSLDQDEAHAIPPPATSPEKLETASTIASIDLYEGLIVRRNVGNDDHPYVISQKVQHNGNLAVVAHPCTSRPGLFKFTNQYGYKEQKEIHFCYLHGRRGKFFHTNGIPKPKKEELKIQGPQMPFKTYIKLEQHEPFDPNDFVPFKRQKRQLTPESSKKLRALYNNKHGYKSPPGSVPAA
ncbi:hypothetical protein QQZ08_009059 [Neonectria magnoliae]|uniref:Uncharacterized protein n=1 Tax=Neonectria magnoliae TaxID=2732573 RepID=A0ABR1HQU9_9HYPO